MESFENWRLRIHPLNLGFFDEMKSVQSLNIITLIQFSLTTTQSRNYFLVVSSAYFNGPSMIFIKMSPSLIALLAIHSTNTNSIHSNLLCEMECGDDFK